MRVGLADSKLVGRLVVAVVFSLALRRRWRHDRKAQILYLPVVGPTERQQAALPAAPHRDLAEDLQAIEPPGPALATFVLATWLALAVAAAALVVVAAAAIGPAVGG